MTTISIIAAIAENMVIGNNNKLPWYLPADLQNFKRLTLSKPIIMGRNTWESLPKQLPNRFNIVVSKKMVDPNVVTCTNLDAAINTAKQWLRNNPNAGDEIMIIGGAKIYAQALLLAHKLYLTRIMLNPKGDTFFPDFSHLDFKINSSHFHAGQNNNPDFIFEEYLNYNLSSRLLRFRQSIKSKFKI